MINNFSFFSYLAISNFLKQWDLAMLLIITIRDLDIGVTKPFIRY